MIANAVNEADGFATKPILPSPAEKAEPDSAGCGVRLRDEE